MPTLREVMQAEIIGHKTLAASKEATLAEAETSYSNVLGSDVGAVKSFVKAVGPSIGVAVTDVPAS